MSSARLNARRPVWTLQYNVAGGTITTGAWRQILASIPFAVSAVEMLNQTGSIIKMSIGTPGNETAGLLPYTLLPGGTTQVIPFEGGTLPVGNPNGVPNGLRKGLPITCQAVDTNATTGYIVINAFG